MKTLTVLFFCALIFYKYFKTKRYESHAFTPSLHIFQVLIQLVIITLDKIDLYQM